MSDAKFRYEIHPRIPMRNVLDRAIIKPTTVELTLDQVKECLKYGPVYRRFNADHIEKVTLFTINALHQEKFDAEAIAAGNKPTAEKKEEPKKVIIKFREEPKPAPVVEEKKEEPAKEEIKEEAPVEKVKEEVPAVEEKVEEVAPVEEKIEEKVEETAPEAPAEVSVEEEKVVESSMEENVAEVTEEEDDDVEAPKANNGGKKKKHH